MIDGQVEIDVLHVGTCVMNHCAYKDRLLDAVYNKAGIEVVEGTLTGKYFPPSCFGPGKLRAFAGTAGFLRRATGPGWALIGDAGYFRDPITAHGITDALREAEFLVQAIRSGDAALAGYQERRDARVANAATAGMCRTGAVA